MVRFHRSGGAGAWRIVRINPENIHNPPQKAEINVLFCVLLLPGAPWCCASSRPLGCGWLMAAALPRGGGEGSEHAPARR